MFLYKLLERHLNFSFPVSRFPDFPTLFVDGATYLHELAIDEAEFDEVGAEDGDSGDGTLVYLVDVHQVQCLQPVPDHLPSDKRTMAL